MFPLLTVASMAVSTMSLAKETNFIKENWKPILGIGATIGASFVVWSIYKNWKETGDNNTTRDLELGEDPKFPPSTLTDAEALSIANRLQNAMGTLGKANTKERGIIHALLSGKNYNDYVKISRFFGKRGYITLTGISKDSDFLAPAKNLSYWLSKELQEEDFVILRKIIPNVF